MQDVRRDLSNLARSLERIPPSQAGGRQIMLIGTERDDGSDDISASLSLLLSSRSARSTWLIDLDLTSNQQYYAFQSGQFARTGRPGRAFDGSLNVRPFYTVIPELKTRNGKSQPAPKLLAVHQIENTRLMVSRFRSELLRTNQKIQINSSPDYWHAVRKSADWTVIASPPLEASRAGLAVCRHMDGVIPVVQADRTTVDQIAALRDEIETHGGHCLGVVVTGVKADARFADRISL